jgi:hypothetical protein
VRRGVWLVLAVVSAMPACREVNPEFAGPGTDGGESSSSGGTSTSSSGSTSTSTSSTTEEPATGEPSTSEGSTAASDPTTTDAPTSGSTGAGTTTGCPAGEMECFGQCTDVMTDRNNCGQCGMSCHPVMETCVRGECTPN